MSDIVFDAVGGSRSAGIRNRGLKRGSGSAGRTSVRRRGFRSSACSPGCRRSSGRGGSTKIPRYRKADVIFLKGLLEEGHYRAVIDRTSPSKRWSTTRWWTRAEDRQRGPHGLSGREGGVMDLAESSWPSSALVTGAATQQSSSPAVPSRRWPTASAETGLLDTASLLPERHEPPGHGSSTARWSRGPTVRERR